MNERMKELVTRATYTVKGTNGCVWGDNVSLEKFSELIVKECAAIALREDHDPSDCILKHFGIDG